MTAPPDTLWQGLLAFVFYYPLFMSFLWMTGAALFWWAVASYRGRPLAQEERGQRERDDDDQGEQAHGGVIVAWPGR